MVDTQEKTQIIYVTPIWKGELPSHPNNPEIGWAYYNTTVGKSFIFDGSNWQIMSQDGINGTSIIWKGELPSAPNNPQINWAYYNTTVGCSYIYDGFQWTLLAQDGKNSTDEENNSSSSIQNNGFIFIKETTETINNTTYIVKCYADVNTDIPYFYIYYKYYYLNNTLRKTYTYSHQLGSCLNYKYTEFIEHFCYHHSITEYFYDERGVLISLLATNYQDKHLYRTEYFYNSQRNIKLYVQHIDNLINQFWYRYDSNYLNYYFVNNELYSYEDSKTIDFSTSSNIYSTKQTCTQEQIMNIVNSLKNSME